MVLYSENKEIIKALEQEIHARRFFLESSYNSNKWCDVLEHKNGGKFAITVQNIDLKYLKVPEGVSVINKFPEDFFPEIDDF